MRTPVQESRPAEEHDTNRTRQDTEKLHATGPDPPPRTPVLPIPICDPVSCARFGRPIMELHEVADTGVPVVGCRDLLRITMHCFQTRLF